MKILFDHQIFSYQTRGGISRYFFELLNALQRIEGASFELALTYSDNEYLRRLDGHPTADVFTFLRRSSKLRFLGRYLLNRRVSNKSLRRGAYDVFHPTFFDPSFLKRLRRRPYVLTLMDMTPELFPALFSGKGLYNRFITSRWIEGKRILAQNASKVIAISQNTKNDAVRFYGLDASKVAVIHLASSLKPDALQDPAALDLSRPFLLFVGSRFGYKNFDGFVRALAPVLKADADLRIVCAGGGPFTDSEIAFLDALTLRDRFIQLDVSDEQLATLYATARVFVFPSYYEGFGLPIVEAFACGCPCVISRASCFPEIGGDAALYFDPESAESMAAVIRNVLYDESCRRNLIATGRERAKLFSWDETARRTVAVYEEVVSGKEARR